MRVEILDAITIPRPTSSPTPFPHAVPGLLSQTFSGRKEELSWIEGALEPDANPLIGRRIGIYGMIGVGKTQLVSTTQYLYRINDRNADMYIHPSRKLGVKPLVRAYGLAVYAHYTKIRSWLPGLEYLRQADLSQMLKYEAERKDYYSYTLFLNASSTDKLEKACLDIVEGLNPRHRRSGDHPGVRELFSWISTQSDWLILLDNVNEEAVNVLQLYLPAHASGHVIITSQLRLVAEKIAGSPQSCLLLQEPKVPDAINIFLNASGLDPSPENFETGDKITRLVGLLPHAIEQVASYMKMNMIDSKEFITRFTTSSNNVWNKLAKWHSVALTGYLVP